MPTDVVVRVAPSGGDYQTLAAAIAGEQRNLVALDECCIIECEAFVEEVSSSIVVNGFVADATRNITIRAAAGHEHNRVWGAGYCLHYTGTNSLGVLDVRQRYTTIQGIEIRHLEDGNGINYCIEFVDTPGCVVDSCLLSSAFYGVLADANSDSEPIIIRNCLGKNFNTSNPMARLVRNTEGFGTSRVVMQNCTAVGCGMVHEAYNPGSRNVEVYNCVSFGLAADDYFGTFEDASNNASDDTTAPGTASVHNITSAAFADYAGGDYTPAAGGVLDGTGVDLSADFTNDITGAARTQWDIGAFAIAAADTTAPTLTSPTGTATGQTTASGTVSTDEGNGTLDAVVTTSSTTPSAAQIQAGQDHTGSAAVATDLNNTVTATGSQSVSFTGLTAGTTYYVHYVHEDDATNVSTAVTSASFTTDAVRVGFNLPSSGVIYDGNADTQVANDTDCTLLAWNSATLPGAGAGAPDVILTGLDLTSGVIEVDLSGESPAPSIGDNYSGFVYWTRADSSVPAFRFINAQIVDLDA